MWQDWAIYWTLGNFFKPLAKINLPKSPTFLANFLKVPYSIIFLVKSYLGNFCRHLAIFIWSPGFKYSFKITVNYPPSSSRSFNWISRLIRSWKLLIQLSCRKSKLRIKFTSSRNEQTRSHRGFLESARPGRPGIKIFRQLIMSSQLLITPTFTRTD